MDEATTDVRDRLNRMFSVHGSSVLRYALRRTPSLADAEDAVSETFLVAWRHVAKIPDDGSLPWLLAVCRRVLANQRRAGARRSGLTDRLRWLAPRHPETAPSGAGQATTALSMLNEADQELLRLIAWDELPYDQIATVLRISPNAVAVRAHRARARFRTAFAAVVMIGTDPDSSPNEADG